MNSIKKLHKSILLIITIAITSVVIIQCTKENFVEPIDPFEPQRLEPDPYQLVLGEGSEALTLKVNHDNIEETSNGLRVKGGLFAENDLYGDYLISNGDFEFTKEEGSNNYSNITGFALVQLPTEGFLKDLVQEGISACPVGFKKGSEFETGAFGWPLNEDRYYFYYQIDAPFDVRITNTAFDNIKKLAIDPTDPYFFISCDFEDVSEVGLAFSAQGLIPFDRYITYYDKIETFNAQLFLSAAITLAKYPITIHGETYIGFNPDDSTAAEKYFLGEVSSYKQGFNGLVTLDHEVLDWLNLEVALGGSSALLSIETDGTTRFSWAGEKKTSVQGFLIDMLGVDWDDFTDFIKTGDTEVKFWGTIGNELKDWEMGFQSKSELKVGDFSVDMGTMKLYLSPEILKFYGSTYLVMFGNVGVKGQVENNGHFYFTGFMDRHSSYEKYGLKFSIDFDLDLTVKNTDNKKITLSGDVDLKAEICLGKICIDFNTELHVSINTNGEFTIRFKIGICGKGFSVTLKYRRSLMANVKQDIETCEVEEIPYHEIPMQYRFAEDVSYEEAMSGEIK